MNIYLINNKINNFLEKNIFDRKKKVKKIYFHDFRSDPDPLFHETDSKIRIHFKMKRIRNTLSDLELLSLLSSAGLQHHTNVKSLKY